MKKREAIREFVETVLPSVMEQYEQDNIPDKPARREAFCNFIDSLNRDGRLSEKKAYSITLPDWIEDAGRTRIAHELKCGRLRI